MVTYDEIQGIYRAEKRSPNSLERIDDNFYRDTLKFISGLGELHKSEILNIIKEILQIRMNKILRLATRTGESSPPENMVSAEKEIYDKITGLLTEYRCKVLLNQEATDEAKVKDVNESRDDGLVTGQNPVEKVKLQILRQMPSIIGSDMVHYGPFNDNDIVEIPRDTARILIERGIAEVVESI